jgi:hypothetical protein
LFSSRNDSASASCERSALPGENRLDRASFWSFPVPPAHQPLARRMRQQRPDRTGDEPAHGSARSQSDNLSQPGCAIPVLVTVELLFILLPGKGTDWGWRFHKVMNSLSSSSGQATRQKRHPLQHRRGTAGRQLASQPRPRRPAHHLSGSQAVKSPTITLGSTFAPTWLRSTFVSLRIVGSL